MKASWEGKAKKWWKYGKLVSSAPGKSKQKIFKAMAGMDVHHRYQIKLRHEKKYIAVNKGGNECLINGLNIPAHSCELHGLRSRDLPSQYSPPLDGWGLVQLRERVWIPPPHLRLQVVQGVHLVQPPSTNKMKQDLDITLLRNYNRYC